MLSLHHVALCFSTEITPQTQLLRIVTATLQEIHMVVYCSCGKDRGSSERFVVYTTSPSG